MKRLKNVWKEEIIRLYTNLLREISVKILINILVNEFLNYILKEI